MSKNNTIRKSDKKFIRLEKARIRSTVFDLKKQEELINTLYKKFVPIVAISGIHDEVGKKQPKSNEVKKEVEEVKKEIEVPKKAKKVTSKK